MFDLKSYVKGFLLLSTVFLVMGAFSYFYEARSIGLLPVINYPLRPYVLRFLILGALFLFLGIMFHKFTGGNENSACGSAGA